MSETIELENAQPIIREPASETEKDWLEDSDRFFEDDWEEELSIVVPHGSSERRLIAEVNGELCAITIETPGAFDEAVDPDIIASHILKSSAEISRLSARVKELEEGIQRLLDNPPSDAETPSQFVVRMDLADIAARDHARALLTEECDK